jgi:hypothetical protein
VGRDTHRTVNGGLREDCPGGLRYPHSVKTFKEGGLLMEKDVKIKNYIDLGKIDNIFISEYELNDGRKLHIEVAAELCEVMKCPAAYRLLVETMELSSYGISRQEIENFFKDKHKHSES